MNEPKPLIGWDNKPINVKPQSAPMTNPCLAKFGANAQEGVICKHCVHLRYTQGYHRKFYWCDEVASKQVDRKPTHMPGWQACTRFEQRVEPYYGG